MIQYAGTIDPMEVVLGRTKQMATEPVADEVSIDELRSRAKAYYLEMGWEAGSKLSAHSVIELMAAFGMKAVREPPASCGYPSCGCDHDAVCNVALATPSGDSGALREALLSARAILLGERWRVGDRIIRDIDAALSKGEPDK